MADVSAGFDLGRIGQGLPFAADVDRLAALASGPGAAVVVQAPPGTGKTTLVPAVLANVVTGRVVVTQPRRIAVRAAARRLAHLDGSPLGARSGFSVRGERVMSETAPVEFVTPGLLLRRLLADPALSGIDALVLDEVHERQLDTDLLLALLTDVRELRDDLVVVVMSATLDAPRYVELLTAQGGQVAVVDTAVPAHPLEVRWRPAAGPRLDDRGVRRDFLDHVAATAAEAHARALATDASVDALVFLPGAREVDHVVAALATRTPGTEVLALHGRVAAADQDDAIAGRPAGGPPRMVVSTALAESALTVPGVRLVVDSGLAREPRVDRARGMSGLVTVAASRATAVQRAGRAVRLGPGTVVRCYEERTHLGLPDHLTAELLTSDLTSVMLFLSAWGAPAGAGLRWLDAPPPAAVEDATAVLRALEAVDDEGRVTAAGRRLAGLPLAPRWGRALLETAAQFGAGPAAEIVAAASGDFRPDGADLGALVQRLRAGRHPQQQTWRREVDRLRRVVGAAPERGTAGGGDPLSSALVSAWPERVARRTEGTTYLLARGTRAGLPADSSLVGEEWLAVAEVTRATGRQAAGTGAVIRAAAALAEADVLAGALVGRRVVADLVDGRLRGRSVVGVGAIELTSTPIRLDPVTGAVAVAEALRRHGLGLLTFSGAADALRRRLALLHRRLGAPWPATNDEALVAAAETWLGPELRRLAEGAAAGSLDLLPAVRRLLPWPEAARLDELAPAALQVPSGRQVALVYPPVDEDGPVRVEVKLQECFGLAESPLLLGTPVLFHLLSPAGRPLAVTDDLASFWAGPYRQVRAEMRGRYPKHPWPEDPWTARPTRGTGRSSGS